MDWGTISSWIAAAIAVLTYALTVFRAWWNRPMADWRIAGDLLCRDQKSKYFEATGKASNFGDGPAHRVTVWVQRGDRYLPDAVAVHPLLNPGDSLDFTCALVRETLDEAVFWITWTPPPLRRRSEDTSPKWPATEVLRATDLAAELLQRSRDDRGESDTP